MYRRLVGVQLRSQLQYPAAFVFDVTATALITMLEFGSVVLVVWRFDSIGGWSIHEVAVLYGVVELSFGLMDILFSGFDPQTFGQNVRRGAFDQVLLRPVNITFQVLGSRFVLRRLGRVALGLAILAYGITTTSIAWTPSKLFIIPVAAASQVAFFGGLFIIGSTITF